MAQIPSISVSGLLLMYGNGLSTRCYFVSSRSHIYVQVVFHRGVTFILYSSSLRGGHALTKR